MTRDVPLATLDVLIRRNADGAEANYKHAIYSLPKIGQTWAEFWVEDQRFWWTEGNASCDCNRSLFFYRARGEDEPGLDDDDEDSALCGGDKFSIPRVTFPDGTFVENIDEGFR